MGGKSEQLHSSELPGGVKQWQCCLRQHRLCITNAKVSETTASHDVIGQKYSEVFAQKCKTFQPQAELHF